MQYHMPIGYRIRNGKVEIDGKKKRIVQEIFDKYEKGMPLMQIAESLVERKVENGKGKINWTHVSVDSNKAYTDNQTANIISLVLGECKLKYEPSDGHFYLIYHEGQTDEVRKKADFAQ